MHRHSYCIALERLMAAAAIEFIGCAVKES